MQWSLPSQCAVASQASASYTSAGLVNGVFSFKRKLFSFLVSSSRRPLSARDPWCLEASEATVPTRALIRYSQRRTVVEVTWIRSANSATGQPHRAQSATISPVGTNPAASTTPRKRANGPSRAEAKNHEEEACERCQAGLSGVE